MIYRQFGAMVPKSSILIHFGVSLQVLEMLPVGVDGLAREGIVYCILYIVYCILYILYIVYGIMMFWCPDYDVLVP